MSVTAEVKVLLASISTPLSTGSMPKKPDNAVCIYNSGGYPRSLSGTFVEEPTFQIKVRNTSGEAGEALCETIASLLHGKATSKLLMIQQQGGILPLGRDESNRSEFTINFRCYYRK